MSASNESMSAMSTSHESMSAMSASHESMSASNESMSAIDLHSTETARVGKQEDAKAKKSKGFLIFWLQLSFALFGAKELLLNKQITFITIAIVLLVLFGIRSWTTRSDGGKTFINFMFIILGCVVVGGTIDSIVLNSFIKWVIYGLFLIMVATNPNYRQIYQDMKQIFKSTYEEISSRLKNLFIQSQGIIKKLLKIIIANQEEPSMTSPTGGDGTITGDNNV